MVGSLLLRGMLVGVIAGLLAFGFARVFGEPQIDRAIAFEELMTKATTSAPVAAHTHDATAAAGGMHTHDNAPEAELVSRDTQAGLGLLTGVVVYGAAIGGLFALVFALAYGRIGQLGARATAALLALGAYVAIVLVPNIKYPANPPSVGSPDTIGSRTGLFFLMIVVAVAALILAVALARRLGARLGTWNAAIVAGVTFAVFIAIVQYSLPSVDEVPDRFSAVVLWRFRVASLGMHTVLWTTIGLLFGALTERGLTARFGQPIVAHPLAR
ncbi:MAG: hypothetical protein GEU91_23895 [Rhizobiales bacterium]|nr:hypothetical protein [Hyphomicrobiales bacterium]